VCEKLWFRRRFLLQNLKAVTRSKVILNLLINKLKETVAKLKLGD